MNRLIIPLILFAVLLGCKRDPIPKEAIKRDKYIDVLVDVHIAEAIFKDKTRFEIDSIQSAALYMSVLEKHNVTEEQMLITSLYYSRNQREYDKVLTDVLDKINIRIDGETNAVEDEVKLDTISKPFKRKKLN